MKRSRAANAASLLLCAALSLHCAEAPTAPARAALVGGTPERGWEGAGAMVCIDQEWGNFCGAFCSGTLIRPEWVLTAAHCLEGRRVEWTGFYVGPDAANRITEFPYTPVEGAVYLADAMHVHPSYEPFGHTHDLALVHLSSPATGVQVYPPNVAEMSSWIGDPVLYVGFGNNAPGSGMGVKRSGTIPILAVLADEYYSDASLGVGTCSGDSGGGGLVEVAHEWRVVGVNSRTSSESCLGRGIHIRVDRHVDWIYEVLGEPPPDPEVDAGVDRDAGESDGGAVADGGDVGHDAGGGGDSRDAGYDPDGGTDRADAATGGGHAGGSCSVGRARAPSAWALLLLVLGLVGQRRFRGPIVR